ncbi:MAG: DUF1330 domain-containing protein [Pseudomonadota bacterium]
MAAITPTPEQTAGFLGRDQDASIVMVNLLKFKETATYAEGTAEFNETLSGAEAYMRYGVEVAKILASIGAKQLFAGTLPHFMIGDGDWDMVALVRYPSRAAMIAMTQSDAYQAIHHHREAGLAHQDLIEVTELFSADQAA